MSNQLQPRTPITIDLRPQSTQPAPRPVWQMQTAPSEYEMPLMPMPGALPEMFHWITHWGLALALGVSFVVGVFAVILKLIIWAFK